MPKASLRIKLLLALVLLAAAWQFSVSALGKPVITSPDVVVDSRSIDGAGGIVPENEQRQPSHDSAPFGSPCDIDVRDTDLDDLRADTSTRNDQDTPLFSVTGTDALRTPRIVPILLFPTHCFFCLHEHIRERAPPSAVASAKEDPLPI